MNIKRGLKRIWVVLSVLWVGFALLGASRINLSIVEVLGGVAGGILVLWGLLFLGFWIVSGFSSND